MSNLKPIPTFKNEEDEAKFWATNDTTKYFDYKKRVKLNFSNFNLSNKTKFRKKSDTALLSKKILDRD